MGSWWWVEEGVREDSGIEDHESGIRTRDSQVAAKVFPAIAAIVAVQSPWFLAKNRNSVIEHRSNLFVITNFAAIC